MAQHKWHKEIKAWADGAEIEIKQEQGGWIGIDNPGWYDYEEYEYRIKPQPKEPQYLYVYGDVLWDVSSYKLCRKKGEFGQYIGKIKLEVDDDER